jgi:mannose-1-phosphate guanylyltransferase
MLHAMIMAGGGGTRFWPRSRAARPKQFLALTGDRTLLQQASDRLEALAPPERTWIATAEKYRADVEEQLPHLLPDRVIGEPCGRDTAPCIGLGAALIARHDPDATILVTPADHVIEPAREFVRGAQLAAQLIDEQPGVIVTFGIPPTFPSTGYGYIERGAEGELRNGIPVFRARQFREKPTAEVAEQMLAAGQFFWNSGIFVWKARTILDALRERKPGIHVGVERIAAGWDGPDRQRLLGSIYPELEKISIDYAVMQHAPEVRIVQAPYQWDDVGSWLALERLHPQDKEGNTVLATHAGLDTSGCIIAAEPGHLIATVGVHDLLIVHDGDATLVADRRDEGAVKRLVEYLKKKELEKYL